MWRLCSSRSTGLEWWVGGLTKKTYCRMQDKTGVERGERKERGRKEKNVHKDACSTCLCRITIVTTFNAYVDQVSLDLELATGLLVPRSCLVSNDDSFTRGTASLSCTMQEQMQFRLPPLPTGVRGRQRLGKRIEMDRKIACRRTTRVLYLDLVRLHKQSSIEWRSY